MEIRDEHVSNLLNRLAERFATLRMEMEEAGLDFLMLYNSCPDNLKEKHFLDSEALGDCISSL